MKRTALKRKTPLRETKPWRSVPKKQKAKKVPKLPIALNKTKLHKKLWPLFSKYIRERDNYTCITCGKKTYPAQAGHYRTGATCKKYLYYDERNVHCQCYHCNINLSGNWYEYQRRMWATYGKEIDHEFDLQNQKDTREFPYEELIHKYSLLLEEKTHTDVLQGDMSVV